VACGGGGNGGGTGNNPTTTLAKTATSSGDVQTGQVATALANPLRVLVQEDGAPLAGANVTWATPSGGTVGPSPATTDGNGIAAATWTLGQTSGAQTATATLAGVGSVTFTATANPGPAASLTKVAGDNQGELVNTNFALQAQVRVEDQFGNDLPGVTVNWAGAGSVQPAAANSVTNAQGIASVTVAAQNAGGAGTVVASVGGVVGTQTFNFEVGHRKVIAAANISFTSARNNSSDPAVDSIAVNQTVVWVRSGATGHTVESTGSPSFTSSGLFDAYSVTFANPGTYTYECLPHGNFMTGQVIVQ
jgi:plastocyanin